MNCVEISEAVARELARPELVTDFNGGDFTPTSEFLHLINKAHLHLDRLNDHENDAITSRMSLSSGAFGIALPEHVKYIRRIDLEDSTGNIVPLGGLTRVDIAWLRDRFGQQFDLESPGEPKYWARNGVRVVEQSSNGILNGEFSQGLLHWRTLPIDIRPDGDSPYESVEGTPSVSGGQLILNKNGGYPEAPDAVYQIFDEQPEGRVLSIEVDSIESGVFLYVYLRLTEGGDIENSTAAGSLIISTSGTHTLEATGDFNTITLLVGGNEQDKTVVIEQVSIDLDISVSSDPTEGLDIVTMPPADRDYTAVIHHTQYATAMSANGDESWWSAHHPDVLELSIKRQIARDINRNQTEVREYDSDLVVALDDLNAYASREEHTGPLVTYRLGWRPQ